LMLRSLQAGDCVGITPDGPRGPAMVASSGIVNLARLAGVPIVPIAFATSRRRVLRTWDRFQLALPFGRGVFMWGEPIEVARDLDDAALERARHLIESRMNELTDEADRRVGHVSPSPALREREGPGAQRWEAEGLPSQPPSPTFARSAGEGL